MEDKEAWRFFMEELFYSCHQKQEAIKKLFSGCSSSEEKYLKIIELGKAQRPLEAQFKTADHLVKGCQSRTYLATELKEGRLLFSAESDAMISAGLAALLTAVYSGEKPEVILKCPSSYLEELSIPESLTPSRANGLYSIHLRMKQEALKILL